MSTSPSLLVRELSSSGDPIWGNGVTNFLTDLEAVAQLINTRLRLNEGEWWANLLDGLPLWQQILAVASNVAQATFVIEQRIAATPFVTPGGISNVSAVYNSVTRNFSFSCNVQTQFGLVKITTVQPV